MQGDTHTHIYRCHANTGLRTSAYKVLRLASNCTVPFRVLQCSPQSESQGDLGDVVQYNTQLASRYQTLRAA